ncbi:MAG TPA: AraC family transcriptional regulator [Mucilaginibacter sp.]
MNQVKDTIPKVSLAQSKGKGNSLFAIRQVTEEAERQYLSTFLTPHRKDYYLLVLLRKGASRHWIDMVPYVVKPDTFYFTTPPQVHVKENVHPMSGTIICFTEEFLALEENHLLKQLPIIQNPHNGHKLELTAEDVAFIDDITTKILTEYNQNRDWKNSMLLAYLRVLLIHLSRLYTGQYKSDEHLTDRPLLQRFQSLIEDNYTELHDVAAYANLLNITAGHLSEAIKEQSGKTAIEHIHERLVLESKRLLFHSKKSIKEIAFQLGFEDASYFNRFFKRLCLQTPLEYRTATREMYH